jgi:hypothetical protein
MPTDDHDDPRYQVCRYPGTRERCKMMIDLRAQQKDPDALWRRVIADLFAWSILVGGVLMLGALIYLLALQA